MLVPPQSSKKLLEESTSAYEAQLPGSVGEEYLVDQRGLSIETLRSFRIGFVHDPVLGDDLYRGMVSFPFITPSGIVCIQYRAVGTPGKGKRFLSRGSTKRLFNVSTLAKPHRKIYLTEGLVDTLTVAQLGLPVVGAPGVENWESWFGRVFRNRRVVALADGDDKHGQGENFARRVSTDVEDCAIVLFESTDVNKFYMDNGDDALLQKIGEKK